MTRNEAEFNKLATTTYDPIKMSSIDGTDTEPHDRAVVRALHSEYTPNKQVKGDPYHTVFVGRLNPKTTQETVKEVLSQYGKVVHCRLVKDIVTGKSKQYAFVEFERRSSLDKVIREHHRLFIDETEVLVEREAERRLAGWKPRRLGGGFGGRKEAGQLRFGGRDRPFRRPILLAQQQQRYTHIK